MEEKVSRRINSNKEYFNSSEGGIFPIAEIDIQILDLIEEIVQIVDNHGKLTSILKGYKVTADDSKVFSELEKLRGSIQNWTDVKHTGQSSEDKEKSPVLEFLDYRNRITKLKDIHNIAEDCEYNFTTCNMVYYIVFNHANTNDTQVLPNSNIRFPFLNEEARNRDIELLKVRLQTSSKVDILFL